MKSAIDLIEWYKKYQRKLPFRESRDPYFIWVSEIMAQQTRIDTMIPYYLRWTSKWPTIESLAKAEIDEVLKMWEGLGYYNRARKLHEGAKQVVDRFQGVLPGDLEDLRSIPGIGFYTAGAIASIAFGLQTPAVDGNVLRVVTRFKEISEDITNKKTVDKVYHWVYEWMQGQSPSDFTQGLMELGAIVCTPTSPQCSLCPINDDCLSYHHNAVNCYPVKKQAKAPISIELDTYLIQNDKKQWLLSNDWQDGLMQGMVRLPQYPKDTEVLFKKLKKEKKRKHLFSHRIWKMNCYQGFLNFDEKLPINCFWCNEVEIQSYSMVTAHKKWLEEHLKENEEQICD